MGEQKQPSDAVSTTSRWWFFLYWLAAIGIPGGVFVSLRETAIKHLILTMTLSIVWLVGAFFGSLATEVGGRLRRAWAEIITNWLNLRIEWIISRPHKRYCQFIRHQHEVFDMQGLGTQGEFNLSLEEVFVTLGIISQPPHRVTSDPIPELPATLQEGQHTVWTYLDTPKQRHFAILGAPGSGKTTLLKHMALVLASGRKIRQKEQAPPKLPILLFLRDHAESIKANPDITFEALFQTYLARRRQHTFPLRWFGHQLHQGRCLIMLDGLDEIADATSREKVVGWVEQQMRAYAENQFLITSRPSSYQENPISGVTTLAVRPFTSAQVRQFVHNWYVANEIRRSQKDGVGVRDQAAQGADELLQRIWNSPALSRLSVNPLLLTMIATIHRFRSNLPDHRVELYKEICEVFLGKRQDAKGLILDLSVAQHHLVLQTLAYRMMCAEFQEVSFAEAAAAIREPLERVKPQATPEDFLQAIENNSTSLLVEREHGVYSFAHVNFQNYLAARYIIERKLEDELVKRVNEIWWHETISLYCAQADATPIIAACLTENPPSVEAILLAIECDEEARDVQQAVRAQLKSLLDMWIEDHDLHRQAFVADILLKRRLRQMAPVGDDPCIDTSLITCVEYQLFLDEQQAERRNYQPDHWLSERFIPGLGKTPVLGVRPSDAVAFCDWLTRREAGDWRYRLPNKEETDDKRQQPVRAVGGYWALSQDDHSARYHYCGISVSRLTPVLLKERLDADFSMALDLALNRNPDLARELALDQTHARHRPLTRSHRGDFAQIEGKQMAHAQGRDLNLLLALARDLALDRILNSNRTLAFAQKVARNLDRARDRDRDRMRILTLDTTQARVELLSRILPSVTSRAVAVDNDQALAHKLVRMIGLARMRDLAQVLDRTLDLERLPIAGDRLVARDTMELLRWFVRFTALLIAEALLGIENQAAGPQGKRGLFQRRSQKVADTTVREAINACREIYLDFAVLEARAQRVLQPAEGILIVRVRKQEEEHESLYQRSRAGFIKRSKPLVGTG